MIDLHSHIIPTVDDGSKSIEETFNLIKEAEKAGFDKIVCTSHYMEGYYESNRKERETWVNALNDALVKENIKVKLYLGTEVYFTEDIINSLNLNKYSNSLLTGIPFDLIIFLKILLKATVNLYSETKILNFYGLPKIVDK